MMPKVANCKAFARITLNGKTHTIEAEKAMIGPIIVGFMRVIQNLEMEQRDFSTLRFEFSKTRFSGDKDDPNDIENLVDKSDMDEMTPELEAFVEEHQRKMSDPLYGLFLETNQRRAVEQHGAEGWARLRKHIETTYNMDLSHYE